MKSDPLRGQVPSVRADSYPDTGEGRAIGIDEPRTINSSPARSREFRLAFQAAMAAPEVRTDKVMAVRQRIAEGRFTVMADVIAWGILDARV